MWRKRRAEMWHRTGAMAHYFIGTKPIKVVRGNFCGYRHSPNY
jgi:hypothetical protein